MKAPLAFVLLVRIAAGQGPAAVLDDLQQRAVAAIDRVAHASTRGEAEQRRETLRQKLQDSIGVDRTPAADSAPALLYAPARLDHPAPAVVVVRPHRDPASAESRLFAASLARLGFVVLDLDLRAAHGKLDSLPRGVVPQGFIDREVRSALAYLHSRADVDGRRIGLAGAGLAATVAAAVHPEFAAVAIADGAPDLKQSLAAMRESSGDESPDTCFLIPGLLRYASTGDLLAMIAPRPLLLAGPSPSPFDSALDLYRAFGAGERLQEQPDPGSASAARFALYRWFARWLGDEIALNGFAEPGAPPDATELRLPASTPAAAPAAPPLSAALLNALLGDSLPQPPMSVGLQPMPRQTTTIATQTGIRIPMTVLRPGPQGASPANGRLFALDDRGREALENDEVIREAVARGWMVFLIDPRGIGELNPRAGGFVFAVSMLLGENFTWRQAADLARIAAFLPHPSSALYARGKLATLIAAYAAATVDRNTLDWVALRDPVATLTDATGVPLFTLPFNGLSAFDIPDLLRFAKPRIIPLGDLEAFLRAPW